MRSRIASALGFLPFVAVAFTASAQPEWQLVEELRIGGESSETTIFTDLRSIVAGPQGHIFVLDARSQEIRLFDRTGKFVSRVARRGQGPGEIARANGMLLVRDTIWVNDPSNGRWSAWSANDGRYLRQITIPITSYGYLWEAGLDAAGAIVDPISVPGTRAGPDGRPVSERRLRRVATDGRTIDTIPADECSQRNPPARSFFRGSGMGPNGPGNTVMTIPFVPRPLGVIDGRGGYWCSPNDEYLLVRRRLGAGDTLRVIRQPYARLPVPKAERDEAIDEVRKALARYSTNDADYSLVPSSHPVFVRLDADDGGRVWARRVVPTGAPIRFDIHDPTGRAMATVVTTIPFAQYVPLHIRGDHVHGVMIDDDQVPYVVRARIVRSR